MVAGSLPSSGAWDTTLLTHSSHVPSPTPTAKTRSGSILVGPNPNPPPVPSKTPTPASTGSKAKTPARHHYTPPSRLKIPVLLARAAQARGSGRSAEKKIASAIKISPAPPPPAVLPVDPARIPVEEAVIHTLAHAADVASGSGSRGATFDEVVSRFAASCPGGSLLDMAKLPTDILVTKGVSVLAEVSLHFFLCFLLPPSAKYRLSFLF